MSGFVKSRSLLVVGFGMFLVLSAVPAYANNVGDNCTNPGMAVGVVSFLNANKSIPKRFIALHGLITPNCCGINVNDNPSCSNTGCDLLCHGTAEFADGSSQTGVLRVRSDADPKQPLSVHWEPDCNGVMFPIGGRCPAAGHGVRP